MATSGSVDYNQTRNEIILDALALLGVYGVGRTVSDEDMAFANNMLNKMVKAWQAKGIHLWAREEAYFFISKNTGEYQLGNAATDAHTCSRADAVLTQIGAAEASGQTVITVDSTSGMAANDIVGIVLNDKTVHYSTISSVDDGTTITIADALTAAAAENNNVYTYTSRVNKPLRIHGMRRKFGIGSSSTTIPMVELSQSEFFDLSSKELSGTPTHFYYNPDISNGRLYLWPRPDSGVWHFEFSYDRMLEDFDGSADNPDFPSEWLECLTYQLAVRLAPAFGQEAKINTLAVFASTMLEDMLSWDTETASVFLVPEKR